MRVLFIGNSHTYVNDMPNIVKNLAKNDGIEMQVTMIAHPGWHLAGHLNNPEVRFNILYGEYDYIIVQEHAHPFGPVDEMFDSLRKIHGFVKQTKSKMIIYSTWAPKNEPEIQGMMSEKHREIGTELGVKVSDVDLRWANDDKTKLFGPDGEHASLYGSTLIAQALYDSIKEDLE